MSGSSFGRVFVVTTAGESHGLGQVAIVDGCPPGLPLSEEDLKHDLVRRRPGQSKLVTQRRELDEAQILSGVFEGQTTGTPIAILIRNQDAKSKDYSHLQNVYRPGHADFSYEAKYGRRDHRGGGRSSARETASRVAAGAIAKKLLHEAVGGLNVVAWTRQVGEIIADIGDPDLITESMVETQADGSPNPTRCPDLQAASRMYQAIDDARKSGDSLGGVAEICASPMPAGLGEPVFDKLKADLAKALFSLPAVVGVEYGAGFELSRMRGSEANDIIVAGENGLPRTVTNRHGGILGGISTGMPLLLRVALKPTSSLPRAQATVDRSGATTEVRTMGRHDPCLLPRFIPMAEAMVALVLADHWLRQSSVRVLSSP
ncbi:MAG: chorismate synthase [Myxococcales bacterium]|nr:chorismate synthase [Myxococcales bacterium]